MRLVVKEMPLEFSYIKKTAIFICLKKNSRGKLVQTNFMFLSVADSLAFSSSPLCKRRTWPRRMFCFHAMLERCLAPLVCVGHMITQQPCSVWPFWWTFLGRVSKQPLVWSNYCTPIWLHPCWQMKVVSCCCQCLIICQILTSFNDC